ncbi:hypothetical protein Pen01_33810 [Phytomonospora endophytica]|nr:hypothetical protein Pen01_33810 [Phytomonospora endophytica]
MAGALACALTATGAVLAAQPAVADAPATTTALTGTTFMDLVVDEARERIYISMQGPDSVIVADFEGTVLETLTGFTRPQDLSISADGDTVYVAEHDQPSLAVIDTESLATTRLDLPAEHCVHTTAEAGGKLWYTYLGCTSVVGGLASYDPVTGEFAAGEEGFAPGELRVLPERPDRLFAMEGTLDPGVMRVYDVSAGSLNEVVTGNPWPYTGCVDAALFAGGDKVAMACDDQGVPVHNTADLTYGAAFSSPTKARAVAVSPDGRFLAVGGHEQNVGFTISIKDTASRAEIRFTQFGATALRAKSLALTGDRRLVAVMERGGAKSLYILRDATVAATSLSIEAFLTKPSDDVSVHGWIRRGPGAGTVLTVTRTDKSGSHELPPVTVNNSGFYSFIDEPDVNGIVTYRADFAGDADHESAYATDSIVVGGPVEDVDGNDYNDTVVGAPGEDIGDDADTGQIHLLYGAGGSVTAARNTVIHQDTTGVPGSNEDGDRFGHANAQGDFNGDGYGDIAVAAPGENIGTTSDVGEVFVFYGSPTGLKTNGAKGIYPANPKANSLFGTALSVGDFNADGHDELAVGAPGAGTVYIYTGSGTGLAGSPSQTLTGGTKGDRFGFSLDTGDINADTRADLAVGAPGNGSVTVYRGAPTTGLTFPQRFNWGTGAFDEAKGDLPDMFGYAVALADFNGDSYDDLAIGSPGEAVTGTDGKRKADAGVVTMFYSDGTNIGSPEFEQSQKSPGIPGSPGADDRWGATIAAGDSNNDGLDELAVYGAGEDFITVIPGHNVVNPGTGATAWSQSSPGVPGGSEAGDRWGASLRFTDTDGYGHMALIVGAPGENTGAGAITVLYGSVSGLTAHDAYFISQDTYGVPGAEEKNDGFGSFF